MDDRSSSTISGIGASATNTKRHIRIIVATRVHILYIRGLVKDEQSARSDYRTGGKAEDAKTTRGSDALARLYEGLWVSI